MRDVDLPNFSAAMKHLAGVFRLRTDTEDFRALVTSYFRALDRCDIRDLERAADAWIGTQTKFPKPAEWRAAIVQRGEPIAEMTPAERSNYGQAHRQRWEGDPCSCAACVAAGVEWKPIRFVPDEEQERVVDPTTSGQSTFRGHWAHGVELSRWYAAKGAYQQRMRELFGERAFDPLKVIQQPHRKRTKGDFTPVLVKA